MVVQRRFVCKVNFETNNEFGVQDIKKLTVETKIIVSRVSSLFYGNVW